MIKQGITNYFKNLKYVFSVLGVIALFFVLGLSVAVPQIISSVSNMATKIVEVSGSANIDFSIVWDELVGLVSALNWNNPINAFQTMFTEGWLVETFNSLTNVIIGSTEVVTAQITEIINLCVSEIIVSFILFVLLSLLGIILGYFLTKWLIRKDIAKRSFWKFFLVYFIDSLLSATLVALCMWLVSIWQPSIFISSLISIILFGAISLFEAYVVHAWKKVGIKQIVNIKNIAFLFVTNIIILIIAWACVGIVGIISNQIVATFVGIALIEISFIVISLNAESYVKSFANNNVVVKNNEPTTIVTEEK